jgi:hypothetical protein
MLRQSKKVEASAENVKQLQSVASFHVYVSIFENRSQMKTAKLYETAFQFFHGHSVLNKQNVMEKVIKPICKFNFSRNCF